MTLFRSKYRRRIESRLAKLVTERNKLSFELSGIKQTLNPGEYCKRSVAISDLDRLIDEMKKLLL
jgi:hypothetical protein